MDYVALAVIINNYLHDLATGLLLSAAVILWVLMRRAAAGNPTDVGAFARAFPALTRFAVWSVVWIVVGGVPRVVFFSRYEWDPAVVGGIVPALLVKHALMFSAVTLGAVMWRRASRVLRYAGQPLDPGLASLGDEG